MRRAGEFLWTFLWEPSFALQVNIMGPPAPQAQAKILCELLRIFGYAPQTNLERGIAPQAKKMCGLLRRRQNTFGGILLRVRKFEGGEGAPQA